MRVFGGGWGRRGLCFSFIGAVAVVGSGVVETEREVVGGAREEVDSVGVVGLVAGLLEASVPLSSSSSSSGANDSLPLLTAAFRFLRGG